MALIDYLNTRDELIAIFQRFPEEIARVAARIAGFEMEWKENNPDLHNVMKWGVKMISLILQKGLVVVWEQSIYQSAISGSEALVGSSLKDTELKCLPQVWSYSGNILDMTDRTDELGLDIPCVLFGSVISSVLTEENSMALWLGEVYAPINVGSKRLDEMVPRVKIVSALESEVNDGYKEVVAGLRFMEMEWVGKERHVFPRHMRRAAELKRRPPLPEVTTITLRRAYREPSPVDHVPDARDYSCQWMVSGHWRKQLCKKQDKSGDFEYRPVYVNPYLKGPADKPLRTKNGTVYVVRR